MPVWVMQAVCKALNAANIWLFVQIKTSNAFMKGMLGILAAATLALGPVAMFNLYFMPYWVGVVWLDIVTYLHHHGSEDPQEQIPWYRGQVNPYSRAVTCIEGIMSCTLQFGHCMHWQDKQKMEVFTRW